MVLGMYGKRRGYEIPKAFLENFKQRVKDTFVQEWHSRLETSTRARTFTHITKCQFSAIFKYYKC